VTRPLLSILIPTYSYPIGLERILQALGDDLPEECELLIFDDSPTDEVKKLVAIFSLKCNCILRYQQNLPALGAVANWNALLDSARGEYSFLLHHDEIPVESNFVCSLIEKLKKNTATDVLLMDCIIVSAHSKVSWMHSPRWLRKIVAINCPSYLYRRNVIGPVSTLIVRSSIYPRFDENLKWLVDVDLYVRLLTTYRLCLVFTNLVIYSVKDREGSITSTLKGEVKNLHFKEQTYLRNKGRKSFWMESELGFWSGMVNITESVIWTVYRTISRSSDICLRRSVPNNKTIENT